MNTIADLSELSETTVNAFRGIYGRGALPFYKGILQSTGLVAYDLQPVAKSLFPVITPLRNRLPRVPGNGDTATRWAAVTAINTSKLRGGIPEGARNGFINTTVQQKLSAYKTIGLDDFVSFEAQNAGQGFDNVRSRMAQNLLWATMIQEEKIIWGGNSDAGFLLGTTPTPVPATATIGGTIAAATYNVICVALTHAGWDASTVAAGVPDVQTVTQPDGSTYTYNPGTAIKSAAASQVTTGATSTISATVTVVPGAMAYAWYVGTAGNERLQQITTINSFLMTSLNTTNQLVTGLFTADRSQNSLEFDGFMTHAFRSGSPSIINTLATGVAGTGTKLTCSNNDASIDQFETVLKSYWDNYRIAPNVMYVSAQEIKNITTVILKNNGSPVIRLNADAMAGANGITGGSLVGTYLNRYASGGGTLIRIEIHPNAAPGTVLFHCDRIPYPINQVPNIVEMHYRQDYYQLEWPLVKRRYESGVYADITMPHYFPGAIGIVTNITDGA